MVEVLNSTTLPFGSAGLLSVTALRGHRCCLGRGWSNETNFLLEAKQWSLARGISAHIAGDRNKNKNYRNFLLVLVLNSGCASAQQTDESGIAKEVKKIFSLLPICSQKQKKLLYGPEEESQIISTLEMYLLYFGCFSLSVV